MNRLLVFLLLLARLSHAVSAGCTSNCAAYDGVYDYCPSGCTYTNANLAFAAMGTHNGCACQDGSDMSTTITVSTGCKACLWTSSDTGSYATAKMLSSTAVSIKFFTHSNPGSITGTVAITHLKLLYNAASGSSNLMDLNGINLASPGKILLQDDWLESDTPGNGSASVNFSAAGEVAGTSMKIDRVYSVRKGIGASPRHFNLSGIQANFFTSTSIQNSLLDSGGVTGSAGASAILLTNTSKSASPYVFYNLTVVGLSGTATVFSGLTQMYVQNCAFYSTNTSSSEFDTFTAGASPVSVTASFNAFTKLTAYAGTGNIFGLTATAFAETKTYTILPTSALWNTGSTLGPNNISTATDLLGVSRPQRGLFDIGAYEVAQFNRTVPSASIRAVPTASIRGVP